MLIIPENPPGNGPNSTHPGEYYLMGFGETDLMDRKRGSRIVAVSLLVALLTGVSIWILYAQKPKGPPPAPSAPSAVRQAEPALQQRLPSAISRSVPEKAYSAAHPGWERYISEAGEFLVFREGGEIRAIQLLSVKGRVIPDDLVRKLFRETCGTELSVATGRTRKGSYDATTGKVGSSADFLIYRKPGSTDIRGVVLTFPRHAGP